MHICDYRCLSENGHHSWPSPGKNECLCNQLFRGEKVYCPFHDKSYHRCRKNGIKSSRGKLTLQKEGVFNASTQETLTDVLSNIAHYLAYQGHSLSHIKGILNKSAESACSEIEKEWTE